MGGKSQTTTSNQSQNSQSNPWAPAQPLLQQILGQVGQIGGNASNFEQQFGPWTRQYAQNLAGMAGQKNATQQMAPWLMKGAQQSYNAGQGQLLNTANGGNLTGNPYLDQVLGRASSDTANAVNQQFSAAGRYGSGAHTSVLADRIGQQQTQARMGNYDNERRNQLNAAGMLYGAGQQGLDAARTLDNANVAQQGLLQQAGSIQDLIANAGRVAPQQAAQWMASLGIPIAGLGGQQTGSSTGTQTTKTPADPLGMGLSLGMAGLGMFTGNPMMAMNGLGGMAGGQQPGGIAPPTRFGGMF